MIEQLKSLDQKIFLFLNGFHNNFWDAVMYLASDTLFWAPLYLFIAISIVRHFRRNAIPVFLFIFLLILLSDQSSNFLKLHTFRLRPSHEPDLIPFIHLSKAGAGGLYSFVSSHSANAFALFGFLTLILPRTFNRLKLVLLGYAVLVAYSRIYNGVHYPGDVLGGCLLGLCCAWIMQKLFFAYTEWIKQLRNRRLYPSPTTLG